MALRTTEDEVIALTGSKLDPEIVTPFLRLANGFVNRMVIVADGLSLAYEDAELVNTELLAAAHFLQIRDRGIASETAGAGSWTFDGKTGMGFDFTPWGQQLRLFDRHGIVAQMEKTNWVPLSFEIIDQDISR